MSANYTLKFNCGHSFMAENWTTEGAPPDLRISATRISNSCNQGFCENLNPGNYKLEFDGKMKWVFMLYMDDSLQPTKIPLDAEAIGLHEPDQLPALFGPVPNLQLVNRDNFEEMERRNTWMEDRLKQLDVVVPWNEN